MADQQTVELVGGPQDGTVVVLPASMRALRVPMPSIPAAWLDEEATHPSAMVTVTYGEYRPYTNVDAAMGRWYWQREAGRV